MIPIKITYYTITCPSYIELDRRILESHSPTGMFGASIDRIERCNSMRPKAPTIHNISFKTEHEAEQAIISYIKNLHDTAQFTDFKIIESCVYRAMTPYDELSEFCSTL